MDCCGQSLLLGSSALLLMKLARQTRPGCVHADVELRRNHLEHKHTFCPRWLSLRAEDSYMDKSSSRRCNIALAEPGAEISTLVFGNYAVLYGIALYGIIRRCIAGRDCMSHVMVQNYISLLFSLLFLKT